MKISPEQIQEETNAYYDSQNAKHWQEISKQCHVAIYGVYSVMWALAISAIILLCPLVPFIWLLIKASPEIWIWLAFDVLVTVVSIWALCASASFADAMPNDTMLD